MPVFGKQSLARKRTQQKRKRFLETEVLRTGKKRVYRSREKWLAEKAPLQTIAPKFPTIFLGRNNFINQRYRERGKPLVVLDWGCGDGTAIRALAARYKKKIRAYGFGKDAYTRWEKSRSVKFIQATAQDLLRYFKPNSVDLIYSHLGLVHLLGDWQPGAGISYINKLVEKLSPGGVLVFTDSGILDRAIRAHPEKFKNCEISCANRVVHLTKKQ